MNWTRLARLVAIASAMSLGSSLAAQQTDAAVPIRVDSLVIGETFTVASTALRETRRINVYFPPGYRANLDVSLPVLYMPDGGMAEDFLHVAGLVQVSVGNGTMRPFILVGIENTERRRDLTGPTTVESDKKIAAHVGGSSAFRAFLRAELFPVIESRYHTTGERGIVGESLAGLFVVETFFREPDLFDSYLAFDPSLWWNNESLLRGAKRELQYRAREGKTLYLAASSEPVIAKATAELAAIFREVAPQHVQFFYTPLPDETHATIYHPAALRAFRAVFAPVAAKK